MNDVGKEYGTALYMLASEKHAEREYSEALGLIKMIFEDREYFDFLASPAIPRIERISAAMAAFEGKLPDDVLSYLLLMCERGRLDSFKVSVDEYEKLLAAFEKRTKVRVTSAVELSEDEKARLVEKLATSCGTSIEAEYRLDSSLIGGLVVEFDGKIIDGSLRSKLREFKEVMRT